MSQKVKPRFTLPSVVQKQRAASYRAVFIYLYQTASEQSLIELDAGKIGRAIGFSRKTVYKAIAFLKRVKLLRLQKFQQGRGNHSLYFLNWRRNRHPLSINKINKHSLRSDTRVARQNFKRTEWGRMMKAFRHLLAKTFMMPSERRLCAGVIGRFIKNKSLESCSAVYESLARKLHLLEPPNWVLKVQDLCRWFWLVLKRASVSC